MNEEIKKCRSCGSIKLKEIISLGNHYVSNFVESDIEEGIRVPLNLILCDEEEGGCGLLQLKHNAPPESMWGEQYWYKSGINPTIRADLKNIVNNVEKMIRFDEGDIVIDIGCNDGTMLSYYSIPGLSYAGFEPSDNVAKEASEKGFNIINNFFNKESYQEVFGNKKAKVITAISMFYDLEDPNQFLEDINDCLDDSGLLVIQQNYLITMLQNNGLDNICHEHRKYYSFRSLKKLLQKHNLEIFDVALNNINGGSIRTYIRKKRSGINPRYYCEDRLNYLEKKELEWGLHTSKPYLDFASRVNGVKEKIMNFMRGEKLKGKIICACGASTKGNTTLQYFGIGPELITCIEEKNPDKFGKKTIGTLIPISSPEDTSKQNPDYLLVLIWYFLEDIKRNQKEFLEKGGKLIVPLPVPKLITKDGEYYL